MNDKRQRCIFVEYIASPDTASFPVVLAILVYDGIFLAIFLCLLIVQRAYLQLILDIIRHAWLYNLRAVSGLSGKIPPLFFYAEAGLLRGNGIDFI